MPEQSPDRISHSPVGAQLDFERVSMVLEVLSRSIHSRKSSPGDFLVIPSIYRCPGLRTAVSVRGHGLFRVV